MKKHFLITTVLLLLSSSLFFTQQLCAHDIKIECSTNFTKHVKHNHSYYELCFTEESNCPEYVVWTLTKNQVIQAEANKERKDNFRPCELGSAQLIDYRGSGYDRGHICPYADMDFNEKAGDETFLMCNMCPQPHSMNAGVWADLEKQDRIYAKQKTKIVVAAGPIFEGKWFIGKVNKIRVPSSFWRVYFDPLSGAREAYVVDATAETTKKVKVSEIEKLTGLKFSFENHKK